MRGESGLHQSRSDTHNTGGAELACELAGEVNQRSLGEVVHTKRAFGTKATDRRDVHDDAGIVLHRGFPDGLGPKQRTAQVDIEGLVVTRWINAKRGPVVRIGGSVVHQDVDLAEALDGCIDATLCSIEIADVGSEHCGLARNSACRNFELIVLARAEHHLRARSRI